MVAIDLGFYSTDVAPKAAGSQSGSGFGPAPALDGSQTERSQGHHFLLLLHASRSMLPLNPSFLFIALTQATVTPIYGFIKYSVLKISSAMC